MKINYLTKSTEDYLETILVLSLEKRVVRIKDLAEHLNVKRPSVVSAVKYLKKKNLVKHEHYGYVELTEKGKALAKSIYKRHKALYKFLHNFLGIHSSIAEKDACRIEHFLTPETMERILKFIEFIETCPRREPNWLSNFYHFVKTGKLPDVCRKC
ncbi:metal-dependent transcriptional regulator [Candidatus Aminicenantes bacterium AH-873-B07]|jgi:DtxR family Mn-dependent transcriptional regulator|nr:metal-dependent transcriptional regulator [Candidatus Aminicenantes bacterium AH-873-B07]